MDRDNFIRICSGIFYSLIGITGLATATLKFYQAYKTPHNFRNNNADFKEIRILESIESRYPPTGGAAGHKNRTTQEHESGQAVKADCRILLKIVCPQTPSLLDLLGVHQLHNISSFSWTSHSFYPSSWAWASLNQSRRLIAGMHGMNERITPSLGIQGMNERIATSLGIQGMNERIATSLGIQGMNERIATSLGIQGMNERIATSLGIQGMNKWTITSLGIQGMHERNTSLGIQGMNKWTITSLGIQGMHERNTSLGIQGTHERIISLGMHSMNKWTTKSLCITMK